jgi:hypothetical protein
MQKKKSNFLPNSASSANRKIYPNPYNQWEGGEWALGVKYDARTIRGKK